MYADHLDGTDWAVMGFWMVLAVALVAVVVFLLASWVRRNAGGASPAPLPSARGVLDERLARGEIDVEEYRQRRSAIERTGSQTK